MSFIIFHLFIISMAVLGFIETIRYLITRIYTNDDNKSILILSPDNSDAEYQLRSCIAKIKWQKGFYPGKIYCVDNGLSADSKEICNLFCEEYKYIEIISADKLTEKIKNNGNK